MRAIDADSLITDCKKYLGILNPDGDAKEYARIFWLIGILRQAPTIEPERKKGKWIRTDMTDIVYGERIGWVKWNCSECGIEKKIGWAKGVNFCPNCGADMREDIDAV